MSPGDLSVTAARERVDRALASFLAAQRERIVEMAPPSARLVDLIEAVVAGGGKRLRPLLCCLAYLAAGGADGPEIVAAAGSLELLHTFAILHDDVMDQAELRRGRPALHRRLAAERRESGHDGPGPDADVYGVSVAVLAGDLALVLSDAMMTGSGFPPAALSRALGPLEAMRVQAVAGQYLDLHQAGGPGVTAEEAGLIARLKTADYSVVGPVAVGLALSGAFGAVRSALEGYAEALGEAFSLRDEVLGVFGDPHETGKDPESDLRRGKPTTIIATAMRRAGPEGRRVIEDRWGNPTSTLEDLAAVREAVEAAGARREAEAAIASLVETAVGALRGAGLLEAPLGQALAGLARILVNAR